MVLPTLHTTATEPSDTWISNEYLPYIKEISNEYHICPEMVMAIIEHESSGQADVENALTRTYENRTEYAKSIMNRTVELERLHEETESDFGEGL